MDILIKCFLLVLALLMFRVHMKYKLAILFFSSICLRDVSVDFIPFGACPFILSIFFCLSEWMNINKYINQLKKTLLIKLIFLMIVATLILAIYSPHYHTPIDFVRLLILELVGNYFVIAYSFLCVSKLEDLKPTVKAIGTGLIVVTFFGVINYFCQYSIWYNLLYPEGIGTVGAEAFQYSNRFRVQSTFVNPFNYGYICILICLVSQYLFVVGKIDKLKFLLNMLMSIFGIIYCGCRTVILVSVISSFAFHFAYISKKKVRKYMFIVSFVIGSALVIIIMNRPDIIEFFSTAMNTDTSLGARGMSGGSSLAMRLIQFSAVLSYLPGHWLFGRGRDFFGFDLGFSEGVIIDEDLFGMESVFFTLLLERGVIGFLFWFIFYFSLFRFFVSKMKEDKILSSLGLSLLLSYLQFSIMTGELASAFPTLLTLGVVVRLLYLRGYNLK